MHIICCNDAITIKWVLCSIYVMEIQMLIKGTNETIILFQH